MRVCWHPSHTVTLNTYLIGFHYMRGEWTPQYEDIYMYISLLTHKRTCSCCQTNNSPSKCEWMRHYKWPGVRVEINFCVDSIFHLFVFSLWQFCAASYISDKVAVEVTNNPIHFHRLALKERWNQKTRKWKITGQQNKWTEGRCRLFAVAVTTTRC